MSRRDVRARAVASFLAALSVAIREVHRSHPRAKLERKLLNRLQSHVDGFADETSPLSRQEKEELKTLLQGLRAYLKNPMLSSH